MKKKHEIVFGALLATAAWAIAAVFAANVNWTSKINVLTLPAALFLTAASIIFFAFRHRKNGIGVLTLLVAVAVAAFTGYTAYDAHLNYTRTQRPFVTIKELKIELVDGFVPGETGKPGVPARYWTFQPVLENSGNTLTKDLKIKTVALLRGSLQPPGGIMLGPGLIALIAAENVDPPDPAEVSGDPRYKPPRYSIAPRATLNLPVAGRTSDALPADAPPWFLMGHVTYRDIFDYTNEHQMKFCFQISGVPDIRERKPTAGACPHWNCVDDECIDDRRDFDNARAVAK